MKNIIAKIRKELKQNSDPHTKATGQNFFKEKVKIYGVKTAIVPKMPRTALRYAIEKMPKNLKAKAMEK
jgi:3-methyladenine DNA glycosylase AlkD